MRKIDLEKLSKQKIVSAEALMTVNHWSNAYYLAGYSIELAIKAVIASQIAANTIPEKSFVNKVYNHDLKSLIGLAGLKADLDEKVASDANFGASWGICCEWSPEARYEEKSSAKAHSLLYAISHPKEGLHPWIMKYW